MQTERPIVAGTDFSACADAALEVAIDLAVSTTPPARVVLVHVCELSVDEPDHRRLARAHQALADLVASYAPRAVEITGVLRSGRPWEKLDNVAAEYGATLIVVGRHGGGRGPSVAVGTVADHLVRSASRPVLTVPVPFDRLDVEAR